MKTNPWVTVLIAALFLNAAATAVLSFTYVRSMSALVRLQAQRVRVTQELAVFQSLVNDTVEYSKRNPAVLPALRSLGFTPAKGASIPVPKTPAQPNP